MVAKSERPSRLSDVAAVAGGALFLILVGFLAWDAARPASPPKLTATVAGDVRREAGTAYVPVDVRNLGDRPAAAVVLQVSGARGEAATTVVDYLAGRERTRVVVVVEDAEASPAFGVRVRSYQEP